MSTSLKFHVQNLSCSYEIIIYINKLIITNRKSDIWLILEILDLKIVRFVYKISYCDHVQIFFWLFYEIVYKTFVQSTQIETRSRNMTHLNIFRFLLEKRDSFAKLSFVNEKFDLSEKLFICLRKIGLVWKTRHLFTKNVTRWKNF